MHNNQFFRGLMQMSDKIRRKDLQVIRKMIEKKLLVCMI